MQPDRFDEPDVDFTLPRSYEVLKRVELPSSGESEIPLFYIPSSINPSRPNGLWVTVRTSLGHAWTGMFAYGYSEPPGISRIMSSPDPERIIVISRGLAYWVKADAPDVWEEISALPVTAAFASERHRLIVFADFNRLIAYGSEGLRWKTSLLCTDDLKILSVDGDSVKVSGYDPGGAPMMVDSIVDLRTGAVC